ncbi:transposase [Pontibacter qinzhouensis]|uniref:transposase n=1 Tax=Pontibacter qinzhouensis TaxID=2603253 RepID=UPI001C9CF837|nr:transposase [Pontibacter qinzhouensis]
MFRLVFQTGLCPCPASFGRAILVPGKRTVTSFLRVLGLSGETKFHDYQRVLSLVRRCALEGDRILLGQLLDAFLAEGRVVVGIDETVERRWGSKIKKRGHLSR